MYIFLYICYYLVFVCQEILVVAYIIYFMFYVCIVFSQYLEVNNGKGEYYIYCSLC